MKRIEFLYLFRIPFNYLDSGVLPFAFHVKYVERRHQLCSDEHEWFIPDLTWNTQVQWYPNIPDGFK